MLINSKRDWVEGRLSLGTVTEWSAKEIRLISELAFQLSEQGRNEEAISLFEGLQIISSSTPYFQTALGALWLRVGDLKKAIKLLSEVLVLTPNDIPARTNRGEAFLRNGEIENAVRDLKIAAESQFSKSDKLAEISAIRAKGLLYSIEKSTFII